MSLYKGGVSYLPSSTDYLGDCTKVFPKDPFHKKFGQVTNTVDCHVGTGVCFFTVWKFYDDQDPVWSNFSEMVANDCLYYCITDGLVDGSPSCAKLGVMVDENGEKICHKHGVGAVHGMTIGNTDPQDPTKFDILLVFTGKATFTDGESSMRKVTVQLEGGVQDGKDERSLETIKSVPFATDLFVDVAKAHGGDVGGDHAWVDETRKFVWISAFRVSACGIHMVEYDSGKLLHSVSGLCDYLPKSYSYAAGLHGVGSLGKVGSYIALATSACVSTKACAPIPWQSPMPKSMWAPGVFFLIDLASLVNKNTSSITEIIV